MRHLQESYKLQLDIPLYVLTACEAVKAVGIRCILREIINQEW